MRVDRFEMLKELINQGVWDIDLVNGTIVGKNGGTGADSGRGYLVTGACYNGHRYNFKVHEIIAVAGGLNPIDATIDHINGDKLDNRLSNLQVLSIGDNSRKGGVAPQTYYRGSEHPNSKLSEEYVINIKHLLRGGETSVTIANRYNVSPRTVRDIKRGKIWGWLQC